MCRRSARPLRSAGVGDAARGLTAWCRDFRALRPTRMNVAVRPDDDGTAGATADRVAPRSGAATRVAAVDDRGAARRLVDVPFAAGVASRPSRRGIALPDGHAA